MGNGKKKTLIISISLFSVLSFLLFFGWSNNFQILTSWLSDRGYDAEQTFVNLVFLSGLLISFFVAFIVYIVLENLLENTLKAETRTLDNILSSQQMLLRLYEESPVPYFLIESDGKIYFPNRAALRLFSGTTEEVENISLFQNITGEDQTHIDTIPALFKQRLPINNEEVRLSLQGNEYRWVMLSIFPLQKEEGKAERGLVTLVDITEKKKVDQAKTEFVSLASHQLRSPLSAVKWYAELLISGDAGELSSKQKRYVEKVYSGNERMIDLVETLLNVSRLELGTLIIDLEKVEPVEIIESVLEELNSQISLREQKVEKNFDSKITSITTDPKLFRMIVQNLLSNATKYSPDDGRITTLLQREGNNLIFEVRDTGIGIPKEQQGEIFNKLFRANNATQSDVEGTGLGLYIVKKVSEALGGSISFESEEGKGATFTVLLPIQ